ncbi:mitochondrial outer membrane protein porin 5-like [Rutidosis leptorrhynchoides]|uniref:mitochondrial outer membrane protein porin 5-like n=1 Tax=Rutidosis leptorrhynchoides TaxID=125765 RepID=UPI003A999A1E
MKTGPDFFSSYGKKCKGVLNKGYLFDQTISITTPRVSGLALASTAANKDGVFTGEVGAVYKSKNSSIGVKFDPNSNITLTLSFKGIKPLTNTTTSFIFHDTNSRKIATTLTSEDTSQSTRAIASLHLPNFDTSKLLGEGEFIYLSRDRYRHFSQETPRYGYNVVVLSKVAKLATRGVTGLNFGECRRLFTDLRSLANYPRGGIH